MNLGVMGIFLRDRRSQATDVQTVLTKHGDLILSRTGVHKPTDESALITLALEGHQAGLDALKNELDSIEGVDVRLAMFAS